MKRKTNFGFTLVEILIVVVILAVLAATIIPQFTDSTNDARESTAKTNLHGLRGQIQIYRAQHIGQFPTALDKLSKKTNADHTEAGSPALGPYALEIPGDGITGSNAVAPGTSPITATGTTGGWLYDPATGEIRINHEDYDHY